MLEPEKILFFFVRYRLKLNLIQLDRHKKYVLQAVEFSGSSPEERLGNGCGARGKLEAILVGYQIR